MSEPASATFQQWAECASAIRATTKRLEKLALLDAYFPTLDDESLSIAAHFFSGVVFPRHDQRTTQVGGALLFGVLAAITEKPVDELREGYIRWGDSGDFTGELFAGRPSCGLSLT